MKQFTEHDNIGEDEMKDFKRIARANLYWLFCLYVICNGIEDSLFESSKYPLPYI